jgi:tetratricopeptide (TPR) repeat protein
MTAIASSSAPPAPCDLPAVPGGRHAGTPMPDGDAAAARRAAIQRLLDEAERLVAVDPLRMERVCLDAIAQAEGAEEGFLGAMARFKLGEAYGLQDRNVEAQHCLDDAQATFLALDRPVEAARTRLSWMWVTMNLGDEAKALKAARAARRVFVAHGERLRLAALETNVGILHRQAGRHRAALRHYRAALALFEVLGVPDRIARTRHNMGLALCRMGRYREALPELESALAYVEQADRGAWYALGARNLGETLMSLGRYTAALRAFGESEAILRSQNAHAALLWLAPVVADCYLRLNRPADALQTVDQATVHLSEVDGVAHAYSLAVRRVAALMMLGDRQAALGAIEAAERTVTLGERDDRTLLALYRAAALDAEGKCDQALLDAQRAYRLAHASGSGRYRVEALLIEGSALLAAGRLGESDVVAHRALRNARSLAAAPSLHRVYELLARIAEAQGRPHAARRRYAWAIDQLERERRGVIFEFRDSFAADRGAVYERFAALQLSAGDAAGAWATAERAKSRALADAIAGNVELKPRGSRAARRIARELHRAREDYSAAAAWLASLPSSEDRDDAARADAIGRMKALEAAITSLVRRLQLEGGDDAAADVQGLLPVLSTIRPAMGTALIEFFQRGPDLLRFVIDASGVRGEIFPNSLPEIERAVRAFRLNLAAVERASGDARARLAGRARESLQTLHGRLLADLALPAACEAVTFIPHGILHYVPFHALHDGERFLIERFDVSYAPSATLLGVVRQRAGRRRRGGALVLAHSADGALPEVLAEAEVVGEHLGARVHAEAGATRVRLAEEGRRAALIHVAAHGQFRQDAPLFSSIQLADGPLTTADVFNLTLPAALVTLSACETGRAVLGGGDELVGLARAFLYAGVAGLLVSQWRVEDGSTAALMARFYAALRSGPLIGHARALREAQVGFLRAAARDGDGRDHPFFWAGFQLIGGG